MVICLGPIAINWIDIITDISAQESLTNFGIGNYCATILNNILNTGRYLFMESIENFADKILF